MPSLHSRSSLFGTMVEPEELIDPALRRVDELLDDPVFSDEVLAVLRRRHPQSARLGRPGTPAEVVLRMLVLKHMRRWSYDELEWEVTGNVVYRRFCRIDAEKVPDAKTMVRYGQLLDGAVLRTLFDRVVGIAVECKVTRGQRMRVDTTLPRAEQIVRQTRARIVHGITDSAGKLLSIFEPYAQILRRGKLRKPTEFGTVVKVQEAEGGIVTDIAPVATKCDATLLVSSVERHVAVFKRAPQMVATDRGFWSGKGERRIKELGVEQPAVPRQGYRSPARVEHERQRWFRRGRKWRQGGEACISRLKNRFGMARSRYRGEDGMARTAFWAAIAGNLLTLAARSA